MPTKPTVESRLAKIEAHVSTLQTQMADVLAKPALRKRTERGVCALGIDPSENCTQGSLGKFQSGCHGAACLFAQAEYFKEYRARRRAEAAVAAVQSPAKTLANVKATKVANPTTKRPVKRARKAAEAPQAEPVKRGVKRRRG